MPTIAVIMPVYNAAQFLEEAVRSICMQDEKDWALYVINDGSEDESGQILDRLASKDHRIHVTHADHASGNYTIPIKLAIQQSDSAFIARMDADDRSRPDRFHQQLTLCRDRPELVAVGGWIQWIDQEGRITGETQYPETHEAIRKHLLQGKASMAHPLCMIRRDALEKAGGYDIESCPSEDHDLLLRLSDVGCLYNPQTHLLDYRKHQGQVTHVRRVQQLDQVRERLMAYHESKKMGKPDLTHLHAELQTLHLQRALQAIQEKDKKAALEHSKALIRLRPFDLKSWRVLKWAYGV